MWDLPGPGLEPVFPALAGGFLTTALPGKAHSSKCKTQNYKTSVGFLLLLLLSKDVLDTIPKHDI